MRTAEVSRPGSWLFVGLMVLLSVLVVAGFSPRYYWPLVKGEAILPLLQHWSIARHSSLNLAWLVFFVLQAALVSRRHTDIHIRLGRWFAAYGVLLVIANYWVGMVIEARRVALGASLDQVLPMTFAIVRDLVMFVVFLVAGLIWRRRPAVHRALMFLATYSLVVVGLGRFLGMLAPFTHMAVLFAIFLGPIVVAGVYDWRSRQRAPLLYAVGLIVYLLFRSPVQAIWLPMRREHWPPVGRVLLQPFL
jgi:hypothetical protein